MENKDFKILHNEFKHIEQKIKEYDTIVIYRHQSPDYDALGSQYGLKLWIKDNFNNKKVYCLGDTNSNLIPIIYPLPDNEKNIDFNSRHLAITLDVADYKRIASNNTKLATEIIKIDHHPLPNNEEDLFGNFLCIHPNFSSVSELLALFFLSRNKKYILSKDCAMYLYSGIVGDTNRFLYPDTSVSTFSISSSLLATNFNKDELYEKMYEIDLRKLNILKFTLNNYKVTSLGTVYIIYEEEDLLKLNMETYEGNNYLNELRNLKESKIVLSITYIASKDNYRVSFRSKNIPINELASKYNGGGHKFASGGYINNLAQLDDLLKDCDLLIKKSQN